MKRYIALALLPLILLLFFAGELLAAKDMNVRYLQVNLVLSRLRVRNYLDVDYSGTYADALNVNYTGSGNSIFDFQADSTSVFTLAKDGTLVLVGTLSLTSLGLNDTDVSNTLSLVWNENDSSDRILNFLVASGDRSITLNENFTIGNGFDFTLTAEDASGSILLDNITAEIENGFATQRLFKLIQGTDAAATLTVEGGSAVVNQDTTTDGTPTFGDTIINGADPALIFDPTTADTEFYIAINEDAGGDDDDTFTIGKGVTKGTTPFMTWDKDGGFIAQNLADATTGYQWLDSDGGTPILNVDTTNERVGIGIVTPLYKLDIMGDLRVTDAGGARFTSGGTDWTSIDLRLTESGSSQIFINYGGASGDQNLILGTYVNRGDQLVLHAGNNVGLNTLTPDTSLEASRDSEDTVITVSTYDDDATELPGFSMRKADNTEASPALVDDDDVLGQVSFSGHDGSGFHEGARIEARIDGTPSDGTDMPTELSFWTTPDGSATAVERMTINPAGQLVIDGGSGTLPPTVVAPLQVAVDANGRAFVLSRTGAEYVDFVAGGALKGMRGFGTIDFTIENTGDIFFAPGAGEKIRINANGELSGDPLNDQFSEMLIGDILSQATTPPGLWVLGLTPATTEPDQGAPPASAHDATYNNFTTSDQVAKSLAWTLNFFDGGDEYLNIADDPAFSWDDSGANPFSMCAWIEVIDTAAIQTVIAKYDVQNTLREWKFVLDAAEKLEFAIYDESANVESTNITDAALSTGWYFIVHTYDSTGGAAALSDTNSVWYVDGIAVAESQSNDGAYVAMEDLAVDVTIGGYDTGAAIANFFQGDMGVVWLEDVELTALQVWLYYKALKGYYHE